MRLRLGPDQAASWLKGARRAGQARAVNTTRAVEPPSPQTKSPKCVQQCLSLGLVGPHFEAVDGVSYVHGEIDRAYNLLSLGVVDGYRGR
jgi:hypothetical protein